MHSKGTTGGRRLRFRLLMSVLLPIMVLVVVMLVAMVCWRFLSEHHPIVQVKINSNLSSKEPG